MMRLGKQSQVGALAKLRVAFTGKLLSLPRSEVQRVVSDAGGTVTTTVSRRTHLLVVGMGGWPLLPTGEVSSLLRRAEDLNRRGARIRIISEEEFLEEAGLKERGPALEKRYTADEICDLTGVDRTKLRRWEQLGLIRSTDGRFDFQDLISLRTLTELVERGVRPETINKSLRGLSAILPGTERPLAQLQVVQARSGELMAELDGCTVTAEGQFVLDFERPRGDPPQSPLGKGGGVMSHGDGGGVSSDGNEGGAAAHGTGGGVTPRGVGAGVSATYRDAHRRGLHFERQAPDDAASWLERARELEENEEYPESAEGYRKAIAMNPASPDAFFGLGNVLRSLDRPDAALEMFRIVVALAPSTAEAWYNIADIQEEQDQLDDAIGSLKHAIAACPSFADAYYNLALCFERHGRRSDARRYWRDYLQLDPMSEWADVARDHLAWAQVDRTFSEPRP